MSNSSPTPTILLIYATSIAKERNHGFLENVLRETEALNNEFADVESYNIIQHPYTSREGLLNVIQKHRDEIVILHFSGHTDSELWQLDDGPLTSKGLAGLLSIQSNIKLLFINGCNNASQVNAFIDSNIPAVIATNTAINDKLAALFAKQFYKSLISSLTISTAFEAAEHVITTIPEQEEMIRSLLIPEKQDVWTTRPWRLFLKYPEAGQWKLQNASNDNCFGLPPYPDMQPPKHPFKHIVHYTTDDAPIFFGRCTDIHKIINKIKTAAQPIILLYGQTGVGKSSLLAAGLMPRLQAFTTFTIRYNQGVNLKTSLRNIFEGTDIALAWSELEASSGKPLILVLDQAEEIFTSENNSKITEFQNFLTEIQSVFTNNREVKGRVIISFRKEWLAEIESYCENTKLDYCSYFLEPLNRPSIIECIEGITKDPALKHTYQLSIQNDRLPDRIATDLLKDKASNIAPTLQILLSNMWSQVKNNEKRIFTTALYDDLEKRGVLLSDYLDSALKTIGEVAELQDAASKGLLLDILNHHTTPLGTTKTILKQELTSRYAHLGTKLETAVNSLKNNYLLVEPHNEQRQAKASTRLSHDTLAPIVRMRTDQSDALGLRARRLLNNFKAEWLTKNAKGETIFDKQGHPLLKENHPTISAEELQLIKSGKLGTSILSITDQYVIDISKKTNDADNFLQNMVLLLFAITSIAISWAYLYGLI